MDTRVRRLAYLGLLIALAVVLMRVASIRVAIGGIEGVRLGFGHFPIIMAGILYGPLAGLAVGAMADITGFFLFPMGPYMPHFTLTTALIGGFPALVLMVLRTRKGAPPPVLHLAAAIAVGQGISAVLLVPHFLQSLFGLPLAVTMPPKVIEFLILVPAYAMLMHLLLRRLSRLVPIWDQPGLVRSSPGAATGR